MLIFHRARFVNFVLLTDVELNFSADGEHAVTVIRAENGTGKTTCLRALEWTLYGDQALPSRGKYEIQPIDWTAETGSIEVSGELEFSVTQQQHRPGGKVRSSTERYTLIRKAEIRPTEDGGAARFTEKPTLLRLEEGGHAPVEEPQSLIDGWLPISLREFFFTDGDQALAYISADESSARRSKVEGAVKALLGLDLVEAAANRIRTTTARDLRRKAASESGEADLEELADRMEEIEDRVAAKEDKRTELLLDQQRHEQDVASLQADRDKALERGNKERLKESLATARSDRTHVRKDRLAAQKRLSDLLRSPSLELTALRSRLESLRTVLQPLQDSGRIPASHVPFLRDRLEVGTCVCGVDLTVDTEARARLERLLAESERERETANRLNELYTEAGDSLRRITQPHYHWPSLVRQAIDEEEQLASREQELGRRVAGLETTIASLPDTDIQALTKALEAARAAATEVQSRIAVLDQDIAKLREKLQELGEVAQVKEASLSKLASWRAAETVATDIGTVLTATLETLRNETLSEVSDRMDSLFRDMIVADPDSGIIRSATLTSEYDIVVRGPQDRTLNPDTELNGASRRALTISFILALAEVSGVAAPNVIDTPLGMTSGPTRQELFRVAAEHSSQLVLFLTRSEIVDIEALLSSFVGSWHTLTAMAHHPRQVVNLTASEHESVVCRCSHEQYCDVCERVGDAENPSLSRRS